ncbi:MAG: AAA family ATPase [Rubrivivax sp.]|nr:AAA family ATPase [Rubrivivax sp.]
MPSAPTSTDDSEPQPAGATPGARWRVRVLGGVDVEGAQGERHHRFPSRAIAALLARLALAPERAHAREELVELLWPGVELSVGRNRLRQALSTLKSLLEPAGDAVAAPVLVADRVHVRVAPGALACDAREFEAALRERRWAAARELYRGELMPGHYDDWVQDERLRLENLFERIERQMAMPPGSPLPGAAAPAAAPAATSSARASTPPAHATTAAQPLLPSYLTRWFGAPALLRRLHGEVSAHRLVTLLGPGGAGKTRLAVELARTLREAPDGSGAMAGHDTTAASAFDLVALVSFVGVTSAEGFVDQVLAGLSVRAQAGMAGTAALRQALAKRRVLIVLDNLEHLLPDATARVLHLADELPQAHLLVTSRRRLDVDGERSFQIDALGLPPAPPQPVTLADAAASPAVQMFVDRARVARTDFHLSARNASVLSALVHALGGLPLALELAAARVRTFSPSEMLHRLTRGPVAATRATAGAEGATGANGSAGSGTPALDLLARAGPRGPRDGRHASMEAVIAWSWAQLEPADARLLCASTVFGGPFTAAALADVAEDDDAALRLDSLQSHSMLRGEAATDDPEGPLRFALLPPVREFAAAQVAALFGAEAAARQRARHRQWLVQWARGFGPTPPLAELRAEIPNLSAALIGALHDGAPEEALQVVVALRPALADVALPEGLLDTLAAALATGRGDADLRSRAWTLLGLLGARIGRASARADVDQGVALAAPTSPARARALHAAASLRWRLAGDAAGALALINEAKASLRADDETRASLLALSGAIAGVHERDHVRAQALQREAFALWQQLGNRHAMTSGHYNLAICAERLRLWDEALAHLQAACDSARELGDWQQLSLALNVLGNTRCGLRDWTGALAAYREAVEHAWAALETRALIYALWNAPYTLARLRRPEPAARLMGFASTTWAAQFGALKADDRAEIRRARRLVTAQIGAVRCAAAWAEGERATLAEAVAWMREAGPKSQA